MPWRRWVPLFCAQSCCPPPGVRAFGAFAAMDGIATQLAAMNTGASYKVDPRMGAHALWRGCQRGESASGKRFFRCREGDPACASRPPCSCRSVQCRLRCVACRRVQDRQRGGGPAGGADGHQGTQCGAQQPRGGARRRRAARRGAPRVASRVRALTHAGWPSQGAIYSEIVNLRLGDGSLRRGQVLEVDGDRAVVQARDAPKRTALGLRAFAACDAARAAGTAPLPRLHVLRGSPGCQLRRRASQRAAGAGAGCCAARGRECGSHASRVAAPGCRGHLRHRH